MYRWVGFVWVITLLAQPAIADTYEGIFDSDDHCVAYRTTKDMLISKDVVVVGLSCEVTAMVDISNDADGPRVVVEVPIKSLKSGNILRNYSVSDILGADTQPNLRFTTAPIDVEAIRRALETVGDDTVHPVVDGQLTIAGVDHAVSSPVEVVERDGRRFVRGHLSTRFANFGMEPPTAAGGVLARVHEELDLLVQLDLAQIDGLTELLAPAP